MPPLTLGPHTVWPPVVLAPMAGITNVAFRRLCREQGAGLYVCEMITTRALVERNPKTLRMIAFAADERPRSLQLYGVDPDDHGSRGADGRGREPRRPHRPQLRLPRPEGHPQGRRLGAARGGAGCSRASSERPWPARAGGMPVTVKMRKGIDDDHLTYVEAGLVAQDAGVAAVALHGRTAAQRYSGTADWDAIATLKQALDVPVLGNGDIWEADDALRMVAHTGVRRRRRRARLPRPAVAVRRPGGRVQRRPERELPTLGEVAAVTCAGTPSCSPTVAGRSERDGCVDFRKHVAWYLKGFPVGSSCAGRWR